MHGKQLSREPGHARTLDKSYQLRTTHPFSLSCCWDWVRPDRDLIDTVALSTAPSHPLLLLVYSWPGAQMVPPIPLSTAASVPASAAHSQTYSALVSAPVWKRKSSGDQASPRTKISVLELRDMGAVQASTSLPSRPPAHHRQQPEAKTQSISRSWGRRGESGPRSSHSAPLLP